MDRNKIFYEIPNEGKDSFLSLLTLPLLVILKNPYMSSRGTPPCHSEHSEESVPDGEENHDSTKAGLL